MGAVTLTGKILTAVPSLKVNVQSDLDAGSKCCYLNQREAFEGLGSLLCPDSYWVATRMNAEQALFKTG